MLTELKGDHWRRVRNTLSPTFSTHKMKMMFPLMNESVDVMLKRLAKVADSGESFNIYKWVAWHICIVLTFVIVFVFG